MLKIELVNNTDERIYKIINEEFNKYAKQNGVICNYETFTFIAKKDDKIVGIITGHSYYKEILYFVLYYYIH